MALESSFDGPDNLNPAWPDTALDPVEEGAAHLRGIKEALQAALGGDGTQASLKYSSDEVVRTIAAGIEILLAGQRKATLKVGDGFVQLIADANSGIVYIYAATAAGAVVPVASFSAEAGVNIYHTGQELVLQTRDNGIAVRGGTTTAVSVEDGAGVLMGSLVAATGLVRVSGQVSGQVRLDDVAGTPLLTASVAGISAHQRKIIELLDPTDVLHATNKRYVDGRILKFESAESAIVNDGGSATYDHGLGASPSMIRLAARCKTANNGYAVNEEVDVTYQYGHLTNIIRGAQVWGNFAQVGYQINGDAATGIILFTRGTGAASVMNTSQWALVIRAYRFPD